MKESPRSDFPISVRDAVLEHLASGPDVARRYEGIFAIACNHVVGVTLVPEFRTPTNWPPSRAMADAIDFDAPADVIAARWTTAVTSSVVVTPHGDAVAIETFETTHLFAGATDDDAFAVVLVNVPRETFAALQAEVRDLLELRPGIAWVAFGGGGLPVSTLEGTALVTFLRRHVLREPVLGARSLELLRDPPCTPP